MTHRQIFLAALAGLALGAFLAPESASASPVLIDFNNLALGTVVTNQYASLGALFSPSRSYPAVIYNISGPNSDAAVADNVNISPETPTAHGPHGLRIIGPGLTDVLYVDFVDPSDSTAPATTTSVSFSFVSDVAGIGSITAFDASNNQVDQAISVLGGTAANDGQAYETLTVMGPAISRVAIDGFADVIVDDVSFGAVRPVGITAGVPEPATLSLFAFGLTGLGWARRRRSAHRLPPRASR